jgi:hypothetical protein
LCEWKGWELHKGTKRRKEFLFTIGANHQNHLLHSQPAKKISAATFKEDDDEGEGFAIKNSLQQVNWLSIFDSTSLRRNLFNKNGDLKNGEK